MIRKSSGRDTEIHVHSELGKRIEITGALIQ